MLGIEILCWQQWFGKMDNIDLLKNWVKSIDGIYDYQRASNLKEADNLGELLYIIGASKVKRERFSTKNIKRNKKYEK